MRVAPCPESPNIREGQCDVCNEWLSTYQGRDMRCDCGAIYATRKEEPA